MSYSYKNTRYTVIAWLCLLVVTNNTFAAQKTLKKPQEMLQLNFENASLSGVLRHLASKKNINYVPNKGLDAIKVNLTTHTPYTLNKAWNILLTLLNDNNFTIVKVDDLYRVIPKGNALKSPLPSFVETSYAKLPDSDVVIRYVYLFKNIRSDAIRPVLDQMLPSGSVTYNPTLNAAVITGKSIDIKSVMAIVKELDVGGLRETIKIIELEHAQANDVAELFNKNILQVDPSAKRSRVIAPPDKEVSFFSKNTKILPYNARNSLILLGTEINLDRITSFIKTHIDVPLESPESRLHIKELKYTYAEKIKPILDAVIKPPAGTQKTGNAKIRYFEDMIIAAEATLEGQEAETSKLAGGGNRLLISCNKEDWKRIETFIDKLDKPKPQVAMEILFVDVTHDSDKVLGSQIRNKKLGTLGRHLNMQTQHLAADPSSGTDFSSSNIRTNLIVPVKNSNPANSALVTLGNAQKANLWAVARSVFKTTKTNIISQPYLVANNHEKSTLELVTERNIQGEIDASSTTAVQKQEKVNAKTAVSITPAINLRGMVDLKIEIRLDEFSGTLGNNNSRSNRFIQTRSTMANGEVLIIGGLTRNKTEELIHRTPVLSKIPLIGNLFRSRSQDLTKEDLYIFIRPTIIKPRFEGRPGEYTQLKLDYAKLQIRRNDEFLHTQDPVQRWFFKDDGRRPTTLTQAISNEVKQVEDFTQTKEQPSSVIIPIDPYYKTETSRTIQRYRRKGMQQSSKQE